MCVCGGWSYERKKGHDNQNVLSKSVSYLVDRDDILALIWESLDFSCSEQVKNNTLSCALQDEEKSVRQRRKLTSDTSEVSDC